MKELLTSKRLQVINVQTEEMHDEVASLNESLVDRLFEESLSTIDSLRTKLSIIKDQLTNGDII